MRVILLQDYRGVLTNEQYYKAGECDMPPAFAMALVNAGRAKRLEEVETESKVALPNNYRKLQKLAREAGIPANQSKEALIAALQ